MRATLIHNGGGGSASEQDLERASELLGRDFELEVRLVEQGKSPADLARDAVALGSQLLIASGGDGTVSAVASAISGNLDIALGILPRGTANSIAGHLGVPTNLDQACEVIARGRDRVIDTALVNERPMLLMATLGIHAEAITDADPEQKKRYGVLAYVVEAVSKMMDDSRFEVMLESDGRKVTVNASAVTVANVAPPSSLFAQGPAEIIDDDGLLDVTIVSMSSMAEAVATSFHLATHAIAGWPADRENIAFFRTATLSVHTREPRRLMVDGEEVGSSPFFVRSVPKSLRVRVAAS